MRYNGVKVKSGSKFNECTYLLSSTVNSDCGHVFFCNLNLSLPFFLFPLVFDFSEFPPIASEQQRNNYKHEFDRDHHEYKNLQAELDAINKNLSEVDRELDDLEEGSPQYLVRAYRETLLFTVHFVFLHY